MERIPRRHDPSKAQGLPAKRLWIKVIYEGCEISVNRHEDGSIVLANHCDIQEIHPDDLGDLLWMLERIEIKEFDGSEYWWYEGEYEATIFLVMTDGEKDYIYYIIPYYTEVNIMYIIARQYYETIIFADRAHTDTHTDYLIMGFDLPQLLKDFERLLNEGVFSSVKVPTERDIAMIADCIDIKVEALETTKLETHVFDWVSLINK